ncbi:MAG TPA: mechanosensitive ion channel family protein [Dehalococcoidia bacterium]
MAAVPLPARAPLPQTLDAAGELRSVGEGLLGWARGSADNVLMVLALALGANYAVQRALPVVVRRGLRRHRPTETDVEVEQRVETLVSVFQHTAGIAILLAAVLMLLPEFGLEIAPLLTGIGIGGLALGLGAQSLVRDVVAGIFILLEDQYGKGDVVQVAGVSGQVESVNLRRTVLRDLDGNVHTIPNGQIGVATNMTDGWSRVNLDVAVSYEADVDHAMAVIDRVGEELARDPEFGPLITEPPKALRVEQFGESALVIKVLGVTLPIHQWTVAGELRKRLKRAFDEAGIEIPFPHRVVVTRPPAGPGRRAAEAGGP